MKAGRFKQSQFWIFAALLCVPLLLSSCGKHDDGGAGAPPAPPPARISAPRPTSAPDPLPPEPAPTPHPTLGYLKLGQYGGENVLVTIGKRDVKFQVACGYGHAAAPVQTEDGGIFDISGTYQALSGRRLSGPVLSARFFGFVDGSHLHFEITHSDPQGSFSDIAYDATLRARANFSQACSLDFSVENPDADPNPSPDL